MATLIGSVLVASILGSLHCAGMCGAFAAFAVLPRPGVSRLVLHLAYNGGRLAVYVSLGAIAGLLGAALDIGGSLVGLRRAAAIGAGIILLGVGLAAALRLLGVRVPPLSAAPILGRWIRRGHEAALRWPPILRALAVGLLTALLPCGWLWAFVVAAAGTGHPLLGALTLAAFWVGTVPVLAAIGAGVQRLASLAGLRVQLVACVAVMALGVLSLAGRWSIPAAATQTSAPPASVGDAVERVDDLRGAHPPCCEHGR